MNDFYNISQINDCCCNVTIPIKSSADISFFYDVITKMEYVDRFGNKIADVDFTQTDGNVTINDDLQSIMSINDCFKLRINDDYFSEMIILISNSEKYIALLEYRCNEDAFGFPYSSTDGKNKIRLPIRLYKPQYPQTDKVYQKKSGIREVLYSKIDKEYELETEYIPEEWHRKIIIALSHDQVWIDGELLTKTADYKIDWDDIIKTECGTDLIKGSTKVSTNISLRNSNCQ